MVRSGTGFRNPGCRSGKKVRIRLDADPESKVRIRLDADPVRKVWIRLDTDQERKVRIRLDADPERKFRIRLDADKERKVWIRLDADPQLWATAYSTLQWWGNSILFNIWRTTKFLVRNSNSKHIRAELLWPQACYKSSCCSSSVGVEDLNNGKLLLKFQCRHS